MGNVTINSREFPSIIGIMILKIEGNSQVLLGILL